jgi:uncharacterized membrane protein (DUF106 family)
MDLFNTVIDKIFDLFFLIFKGMGPWSAMIAVSLLTGLLMLFIFKKTSDQAGIRRVKNRIKAHLLELRLFKDSLGVSLKAQGQIVRANLRYMGYSLKPLLVMIVPLVLILIQLNFWFAYDCLQPGQEKGVHDIVFSISGEEYSKKIFVGSQKLSRISPLKTKKNFWKQLFYPVEHPFPKKSPLFSVEIIHPPRNMNLFGWRIHWIFVYFALSIVFGFSLKGFFGVEI